MIRKAKLDLRYEGDWLHVYILAHSKIIVTVTRVFQGRLDPSWQLCATIHVSKALQGSYSLYQQIHISSLGAVGTISHSLYQQGINDTPTIPVSTNKIDSRNSQQASTRTAQTTEGSHNHLHHPTNCRRGDLGDHGTSH